MTNNDSRLEEQDRLIAELLLRISTMEKLLIEKQILSSEEYIKTFNVAVDNLISALKKVEDDGAALSTTSSSVVKH